MTTMTRVFGSERTQYFREASGLVSATTCCFIVANIAVDFRGLCQEISLASQLFTTCAFFVAGTAAAHSSLLFWKGPGIPTPSIAGSCTLSPTIPCAHSTPCGLCAAVRPACGSLLRCGWYWIYCFNRCRASRVTVDRCHWGVCIRNVLWFVDDVSMFARCHCESMLAITETDAVLFASACSIDTKRGPASSSSASNSPAPVFVR